MLAVKAAGDPGTVGKSVKSILSEFKKTRQDTWHVDVKVRKSSSDKIHFLKLTRIAGLYTRAVGGS